MPVGNVDFLATEWPAADSEVAHSPAKTHEAIEFELVIKYTEVSNDIQQAIVKLTAWFGMNHPS